MCFIKKVFLTVTNWSLVLIMKLDKAKFINTKEKYIFTLKVLVIKMKLN